MLRYLLFVIFFFEAILAVSQTRVPGVQGSSSANGFGVPVDSAWAVRLKKYYKDAGIIDTLHRVSASTMSCYHGMPTGYTPPPNRPLPNISYNITRLMTRLPRPSHVIINYPSNGYDSFSTAEILYCLDSIKRKAEADGAICFISTTQPREDSYYNTYEKRLILKKLRDTIMIHFAPHALDFWTVLTDPVTLKRKTVYALPTDLLHLNSAGHAALFEEVVKADIMNVVQTWTGTISNAWEDPANWNKGIVPGPLHIALIRAGTPPAVISSNVTIKRLELEPGADLQVNNGFQLHIQK
jgi:hypothetical protein